VKPFGYNHHAANRFRAAIGAQLNVMDSLSGGVTRYRIGDSANPPVSLNA
jgi:hypothetical protein